MGIRHDLSPAMLFLPPGLIEALKKYPGAVFLLGTLFLALSALTLRAPPVWVFACLSVTNAGYLVTGARTESEARKELELKADKTVAANKPVKRRYTERRRQALEPPAPGPPDASDLTSDSAPDQTSERQT